LSKQLLFSGIVYLFEKICLLSEKFVSYQIVSCFNLKFVPRQKKQQKNLEDFHSWKPVLGLLKTSYECAINNRATQEDLVIVHLTSKEQLKMWSWRRIWNMHVKNVWRNCLACPWPNCNFLPLECAADKTRLVHTLRQQRHL
jgi:hypothetical protein